MSHVDFKKWQCRMSGCLFSPMSNLRIDSVICYYNCYPLSHVTKPLILCHMSNLGKRPCRHVDFRGKQPYSSPQNEVHASNIGSIFIGVCEVCNRKESMLTPTNEQVSK